MNFKNWLRQPTTILGIATFAATVAGLIVFYLTRSEVVVVSVVGGIFSVVHMIMPDSAATPSSVDTLVTDAAKAIMERKLAEAAPLLISDTVAVIRSVEAPAPAAAPGLVPVASTAAQVLCLMLGLGGLLAACVAPPAASSSAASTAVQPAQIANDIETGGKVACLVGNTVVAADPALAATNPGVDGTRRAVCAVIGGLPAINSTSP